MRHVFKVAFRTVLAAALCFVVAYIPAHANGYAVRFGPPSLGNGGANPLNIPPGLADTQLAFIGKAGGEGSLSATGILFGYRQPFSWGGYVSFGGGLAIARVNFAPAIYSAFGMDLWCGWLCWSTEFIQAIGVSKSGLGYPYALRTGVILWTH